MNRRFLIITVLIAVLLSTAALSQQRGPRRSMGGPMMMSCPAAAVRPLQPGMVDNMAKTLQLSKTQVSKIDAIIAKNDKHIKSLRQNAVKSTQALRSAMLSSKYDSKKVKELASKAEKAEASVVNASIDEWTQVRSVLTSGQAAKLSKSMSMQRPAGPPPGFGGAKPPQAPKK